MPGGLHWAIVEPSVNSTIEWITDCGCTITSMSAYGTSKSSCASITSRALLTIVAELIDHRPMFRSDAGAPAPGHLQSTCAAAPKRAAVAYQDRR
jgi:hypothetical protein